DLPYVIESGPIDPFNQVLDSAQTLSAGTVDSGTYVASGETVTLVSAAPREGTGNYLAAASAPDFADGALTTRVTLPASTSKPVTVTLPTLSPASGSTGSVVASVSVATPGKFDQGELLISHEGALVGTASLNGVLAQGGSVSASVPTGTDNALYY